MVFFDGGTNLIDSGMLRKLLSELGVLNVFDSQAGQGKAPADGQSLPGADQPIPVEPDGGIGDGAGPLPPLDGEPIPVEPDGGIGDGAGPIPFPAEPEEGDGDVPVTLPVEPGVEIVDLDGDRPMPVEPDGGIGDGAGPIPFPAEPEEGDGDVPVILPVEPGVEIVDLDGDRPMPVEPDGGIGDGAGPLPADDSPMPVEPDGGIGDGAGPLPVDDGPMPVEPDGGIGDGAGPLPADDSPMPVEPDGGIGDGAGPILLDGGLAFAGDGAETFYFPEGGENAAVFGFDADSDILDLSATAGDFAGVDDLMTAVTEVVNPMTSDVLGISIDLGDGQMGFVGGVSADDLSAMNIVF